jgi:hypothetical protein
MNDHPPKNAAWLGPESPSAELLELCEQVCEKSIVPGDLSRLEAILSSDQQARAFYASYIRLHGALHWAANHEAVVNDESALAVQRVAATNDDSSTLILPLAQRPVLFRAVSGFRTIARVAALVAIGLLLVGGTVLWNRRGVSPVETAEAVVVAELQSDHDCVWSNDSSSVHSGSSLTSGQNLKLERGLAKLLFKSGASVVVEGPASLEIATANSMRLDRGAVAVHANGPVKDFVVESREASVVDLGTSFGVYCGEEGNTEVEVFEGAVEVFPGAGKKKGRVLGVGAAAKIGKDAKHVAVDALVSETDRFGDLLEVLWSDMKQDAKEDQNEEKSTILADFDDAPIPGAVDTFYGAVRGRGWLTPWVAAGNPLGDVTRQSPLVGTDNPYLRIAFSNAHDRTIARAYGARREFDPMQPHLISWSWRFDGTNPEYGKHFGDRVAFYGNPSFRRGSSEMNSWLIGVAGANERDRSRRRVFADRWYFFNGDGSESGKVFQRRNMVDTGMKLKRGVAYHFAIAVYPREGRYDAAIRDDSKTFVRTGLNFRNHAESCANVIHFSVSSDDAGDDTSFSLDAVRIEPLAEGGLEQRIQTSPE